MYYYVFGERSDHCPEGAVAQSAITITTNRTKLQIVTLLRGNKLVTSSVKVLQRALK